MTRPHRSLRRPAGLLALALVALAGAGARGDEGRWVGTWAASPQRTEPANMPPAPGLADATLRQVRPRLAGRAKRCESGSPTRSGRSP